MKNALSISLAAFAATSLLISGSALAYEAGDWRFTAGMTTVDPEQDNGSVAGECCARGVWTCWWMTIHNLHSQAPICLRLHGVSNYLPHYHLSMTFTVGGLATGSTKHLPPTLSVQYHFNSAGKLIPYVGLGVNYTIFFSEKTTGQLEARWMSL